MIDSLCKEEIVFGEFTVIYHIVILEGAIGDVGPFSDLAQITEPTLGVFKSWGRNTETSWTEDLKCPHSPWRMYSHVVRHGKVRFAPK